MLYVNNFHSCLTRASARVAFGIPPARRTGKGPSRGALPSSARPSSAPVGSDGVPEKTARQLVVASYVRILGSRNNSEIMRAMKELRGDKTLLAEVSAAIAALRDARKKAC